MSKILTLFAMLGLATSGALAGPAADDAYRAALARELDNRALARQVVGALAEHHQGTPQGEFWAAYVALEQHNIPLYQSVAARHELSASRLKTTLKASASIPFARLFPERFLTMLAGATQDYLAEMRALAPPTATEDRAFLQYMIAQESVQAGALAEAAGQRFEAAAGELAGFLRQAAASDGQ